MLRHRVTLILGTGLGFLMVARLFRAAFSEDRWHPSASARTYTLERTQLVPAPIQRAFGFFEDPENLRKITPSWLGFEIVDVQGLPVQRGTRIEYLIRPLGYPQSWETEIVEYEQGEHFVDLQVRGPYRYWRHRHTFSEAEGGTLVGDRIEYQLPFGVFGRIAHALVVSRQLRRIFNYRTDAIAREFGGDGHVGS